MQRQTKKLSIPQNEVQDLIITKYISTYGLYEHIYQFYWGLIIGRKVNYPMSKFLITIKYLAIKFEYEQELLEEAKRNQYKKGGSINSFRIAGVDIYDVAADSKG